MSDLCRGYLFSFGVVMRAGVGRFLCFSEFVSRGFVGFRCEFVIMVWVLGRA